MDGGAGIADALRIINSHVEAYEASGSFNTGEMRVREAEVVNTCLDVLSAVSGMTFEWDRRMKADGTVFSGICWARDGKARKELGKRLEWLRRKERKR